MITSITDRPIPYSPVLGAQKVQYKHVKEEPFKAEYPKSPLFKRICHIAYNIFSVLFFPIGLCRLLGHGLHTLAGRKVVPAQTRKDKDLLDRGRESLIKDWGCSPVAFKTPDGKLLDGMHIPGKNVSKQAPTIIMFNGNGETYELKGATMDVKWSQEGNQKADIALDVPLSNLADFVAKGYNVLLFNYRGVGRSEGSATRDGLILDGESAFQYARKRLGVPEDKIILFGHSLGGGIATQVAAKHPLVQLINIRSFASLEKTVRAIFAKTPWLGFVLSKIMLALGWEFDSESKWDQVKGCKWVVHHPFDPVIQKNAGLFTALQQRGKQFQGFALHHLEAVQTYCQDLAQKAHKRPLTPAEIELTHDAAKEIADPHNRALLPVEMQKLFKALVY